MDAADEAQSRRTRDANGNLDKDASPDKDATDRPAPSGTDAGSTQGTSYGRGDPNENGDHDPNADKDGPGQRDTTSDSGQGGPDKDAPATGKEVDEQTLPQTPEHDKDGVLQQKEGSQRRPTIAECTTRMAVQRTHNQVISIRTRYL